MGQSAFIHYDYSTIAVIKEYKRECEREFQVRQKECAYLPQCRRFPDAAWQTPTAPRRVSPAAVWRAASDGKSHSAGDSSRRPVYICQICQRGSLQESMKESERETELASVWYLQLQLQLQQLLWPGQSVALSAAALSNKLSTTSKRGVGEGVSYPAWVQSTWD